MIPVESRLVGFEATALELSQKSGVSYYTSRLLNALARQDSGWLLAILSRRPPACSIPPNVALLCGWSRLNRSLWMQIAIPRIVSRLRPRLCHFTNSIAPLSLSCPYVVSLYDMSLYLYPRLQPQKSLWLVRTILPAVTKRAAAIITVSESSKQDIVKLLRLPSDKVHVIYGAPGEEFRPIRNSVELELAVRKYGLASPFILSVGTLEPRKNLSRLVAAFSELRRHGRQEQLILAGRLGWRYRPLLKQIEESGVKDAVRFLGYVPAEDLPLIYNLARVVAFPSLYEGFGLPVVEAMSCGVPVLTSNTSAMAEVAAGAAVLVDPFSISAIEEGLHRLLSGDKLWAELQEAGLFRAARFSWTHAAQQTTAVYQAIVS